MNNKYADIHLAEDLNKVPPKIPSSAGVYKWWCDETAYRGFMSGIHNFDNLSGNDTQNLNVDNLNPECFDMNGKKLYCIYVGKANATHTLRHRIINNHINGRANYSTLRRSIFALKYGMYNRNTDNTENERTVSEVIQKLYVSWFECKDEEVEREERDQINQCYRMFNIKDVDSNNDYYVCTRNIKYARNHNLTK